ncbi:hypothetical protein L1049_020504 [Liquidambar formosana]|uniref:Protein kinase domain-containing protein n=1 Tax=Liquidambar formosana TaxID=63359 RepID=A0AAP0S7W5_LIQFO
MSTGARVLAVRLMVLLHALFLQGGFAKEESPICKPSSCGSIRNISYPFRLKTDPSKCGHPKYVLSCEDNRTILYLYSGKYYVEEIRYHNSTIRIVDSGLEKGNPSSTPRNSLRDYNFSSTDPYGLTFTSVWSFVSFVNCAKPVNSAYNPHIIPCDINGSASLQTNICALVGVSNVGDVPPSCSIRVSVVTQLDVDRSNRSVYNLQNVLLMGVELWFYGFHCEECKAKGKDCYWFPDPSFQCYDRYLSVWIMPMSYYPFFVACVYLVCGGLATVLTIFIGGMWFVLPLFIDVMWLGIDTSTTDALGLFRGDITSFGLFLGGIVTVLLFIATKALFGFPCLLALMIYKWRRRHLSVDDTVEEFLQSHNNLMPIRYLYSDVKKMTKGFKDKLGEGGYGSVYKGKLRSGHLVAVKLLGKSKSNGQDFINEVATIGRIHHVNVVQLVGFCSEGSKRVLVYDFMTNGSLDTFIFAERESNLFLSWERTHDIALGVAQGIEYLHRGCDMQILHFDIKPHNILLDANFVPKISDFGLAKLYPVDDNTLSLTAARGTIGYIAPELIYKNIGGISYKADVYSFGKVLLEMAGRRKNLNAYVDHSSQIYFPSWIYDRFTRGVDIEIMEDATEDEKKIARKIIIVALWCIQLKPADRPSMRKAVEMLEGEVESLQVPPELLSYPQDSTVREHIATENSTESTTFSCNSIDSITVDVNVD